MYMRIYTSYLTTPHQLNKPIIKGVTIAAPYSGGKNLNLELRNGCNHRGKGKGKSHPIAFYWRHRGGEEVHLYRCQSRG